MSIGTTCKNWLEWAVPVACRASQAFWPAIFFTVGPINCGQRRRCRIHFASSCALQYHGVFVLQVCEASQNGHAKMEGQVLRVATHLDTSHLPCHSYVSLPLSRHVPRLQDSPPQSHLRVWWSVRHATMHERHAHWPSRQNATRSLQDRPCRVSAMMLESAWSLPSPSAVWPASRCHFASRTPLLILHSRCLRHMACCSTI